MSEATLTFKKAITIVAAAWILSLVTTLAFVYVVVPNILRPNWHQVAKFSGSFQSFDTEETDSFHIPSDHWRLNWIAETDTPPPEDVEFRLFLSSARYYPSLVWLKFADFSGSVGEDMKWWGYKDGTEYLTGSAWFSFRLIGARLDWEITVEAYY